MKNTVTFFQFLFTKREYLYEGRLNAQFEQHCEHIKSIDEQKKHNDSLEKQISNLIKLKEEHSSLDLTDKEENLLNEYTSLSRFAGRDFTKEEYEVINRTGNFPVESKAEQHLKIFIKTHNIQAILEKKERKEKLKGLINEVEEYRKKEKVNSEEIVRYGAKLEDRIKKEELLRLQNHIDEMNGLGWSLKTTQAIETGVNNSAVNPTIDSSWAYGYGFSYTEGVMLFWEK